MYMNTYSRPALYNYVLLHILYQRNLCQCDSRTPRVASKLYETIKINYHALICHYNITVVTLCTATVVIRPLPYSEKLSREKTFANHEKREIRGENFRGSLGANNYEWVWPSIFVGENFR